MPLTTEVTSNLDNRKGMVGGEKKLQRGVGIGTGKEEVTEKSKVEKLVRPWPEFSKLRIPLNCRAIRHEECMIVRNWPPAWETLGNLRSAETKQIGETPAFVYGCQRDFDLCQQFLLMSHRVSKSGLLRLRHRKRGS